MPYSGKRPTPAIDPESLLPTDGIVADSLGRGTSGAPAALRTWVGEHNPDLARHIAKMPPKLAVTVICKEYSIELPDGVEGYLFTEVCAFVLDRLRMGHMADILTSVNSLNLDVCKCGTPMLEVTERGGCACQPEKPRPVLPAAALREWPRV